MTVNDGLSKTLFRPVNTYPDIFENGSFFLPFSKNPRPHVAFSNRFCLSTTLDVIVFENLRFSSLHLAPKNTDPVKKICSLETVFKKLRFRLSKTPFTCGRKLYPEKKAPFSKVSGYVWTGP